LFGGHQRRGKTTAADVFLFGWLYVSGFGFACWWPDYEYNET